MTLSSRRYENLPDNFCNIIGENSIIKKRMRSFMDFVRHLYLVHFGMKLGHHVQSWAYHKRELENHSDYCFFCSCYVRGCNLNNQNIISYADSLPSVILPVSHESEVPVPLPPTEQPVIPRNIHVQGSDTECKPSRTNSPQSFSKVEFNNLSRDSGL
ncbi:hypothetical protein NPIL_17171 [Nephila pilipes]|uniref:Uncharacterized protein n=1 Tax=Nephila pilipes TaxID=299642 RepID=A0A8X6QJH1_NEPPI|nr:hypothetical protein NPIL_17171 [Nephila pilipes]